MANLLLINFRKPTGTLGLNEMEKNQLLSIFADPGKSLDELLQDSQGLNIEMADVLDEEGEILYTFYSWDFGSARVFKADTMNVVAGAVQHFFSDGNKKFIADLKTAYYKSPFFEQGFEFPA